MNNNNNSLCETFCLAIIMIAVFACNSVLDKRTDYKTTHAWERFQYAVSLYHDHDMKAALNIVDSLIANDSYKAEGLNDEQAKLFLINIYRQRVLIMTFLNDQPQIEQWARKTAEACRAYSGSDDGVRCVGAEMNIFLGKALFNTGKTAEGIKVMTDAVTSLDEITSWEGRQAQISCIYKMATQFTQTEYTHRLDSLCQVALAKLSDMSVRAEEIEGLTDRNELDGFVDFFSGKFLAWRAYAFVNMSEQAGDDINTKACLDSARVYVTRAKETQWGRSSDADIVLFDVYPSLGMYSEFDKAAEVVEKEFGSDSLNNMYVRLLHYKSVAEEKRGNIKSALQLQRRSGNIERKVYYNNMQSQMAQTVEAHQLDNERVSHLETRSHLQQMVITSLILAIIVVSLIVYYVYRQRKHRQLYEQFRAIIAKYETDNAEEHASASEDDHTDSTEVKTDSSTKEYEALSALYARIMTVMQEQKPYKNPDFDIEKLAALVFSNRTYVSQTINKVNGKNFHAWLAEYRNDVAIQTIRTNPGLSVNEICARTGHSGKEVFSRQFKQCNGITFTEFRKQLRR